MAYELSDYRNRPRAIAVLNRPHRPPIFDIEETKPAMAIELTDIAKRFGSFTALDQVSVYARDGEFLALLGPSGSGKTTLLRIIAGLELADSGTLQFKGEDLSRRSARDRRIGLVFQHYALFRHMTVFDNVAFGLRVKKRRERPTKTAIEERVSRLLRLVQLDRLADRYPGQLSGGQRQRVALARALAVEPELLLLDEPFGALDAKVRKELRRWLRQLHDEMGLTSIFVTHDQEEALELADRVVVMNEGRIEQIGTPTEVYDNPATPFVYQFIGNSNRFECQIIDGHVSIAGHVVGASDEGLPNGPALAFVRPHDFDIRSAKGGLGVPAVIRHLFAAGTLLRIELQLAATEQIVEVEVDRSHPNPDLSPGRPVVLSPRTVKIFRTPRLITAPSGAPPEL
jgi:sulfate transport system ATP-binding protein